MIFIQIREEHQKKRTECSGFFGMFSSETKDSVTLWCALSEWAKKIEPKSAKEQEDDLMSGLKLTQAYKQYGGEGQNRIAALAWLPEEERHRKMVVKEPVIDGDKADHWFEEKGPLCSSKEELLSLARDVIVANQKKVADAAATASAAAFAAKTAAEEGQDLLL